MSRNKTLAAVKTINMYLSIMYFFKKMTSVCELSLRRDIPITMVHGKLKSHVILFNPPYDIPSILIEFCQFGGNPVKIVISHSNRDVSIVQPSIAHTILRTAVQTFQNHRLQMPVRQNARPRFGAMQPAFGAIQPAFDGLSQGFPGLRPELFSQRHSASQRPARDTGKSCSICLENIFENDLQLLPCAHAFHRRCIARWTHEQMNCPECRCPLA